MYQLYIANKNYSSWSLRPWVLMKALGIGFEEKLMSFAEGSNWDSFRAFSPSGKVPCLVDGSTAIWDSLAIIEYLAESHRGVWPSGKQPRAWARSASAEMHSGFGTLRDRCSMSCGVRVKLHSIDADLKRDIDRIDELWTEGQRRFGGPFLAGAQFTAVDAFYAPVAFRAQTYGLQLSTAAATYARHMLVLPAMKEWYEAALVEKWREPAHEEHVTRQGAIVEDLRHG